MGEKDIEIKEKIKDTLRQTFCFFSVLIFGSFLVRRRNDLKKKVSMSKCKDFSYTVSNTRW